MVLQDCVHCSFNLHTIPVLVSKPRLVIVKIENKNRNGFINGELNPTNIVLGNECDVCTYTSKNWYKVSTEFLYSKVLIDTEKKLRLFVRTLSNSSQLSIYLRQIDIIYLLERDEEGKKWDKYGLLTTLLQKCPNLLQINRERTSYWQDPLFFEQLSSAASQGQLSRLQRIPKSLSDSFELYFKIVLLFKTSLQYIWIDDNQYAFELDLSELKEYQTLLDQISEFKDLQFLTLDYQSNKQLSCFEALIEDIPNMKGFQKKATVKVWTELICKKGRYRDIIVDQYFNYTSSDKIGLEFKESALRVHFSVLEQEMLSYLTSSFFSKRGKNESPDFIIDDKFEIGISLKTEEEEVMWFIANKHGLTKIDEEYFDDVDILCFIINCRSLSEFRKKAIHSPSHVLKCAF
ncbi:hypothetical protein BD770DRAFT_424680 [Pilaira anomala]|nr:hypothetical protein BD770DRAFT_424680 [Pilaira anomala]